MTYFHIRNSLLDAREMQDKKKALFAIMSYVRMLQDKGGGEATDIAWAVNDYECYFGKGLNELIELGYLKCEKIDGSTMKAGGSVRSTGIPSPIYHFFLTEKAMQYAKMLRSELNNTYPN